LCSSRLSRRAWSRSSSEAMRTFRSARTMIWAQLPPPSVGGLRRRGPVTWPFALPHPAPSRRPRAVSNGCLGSATPPQGASAYTVRSTDLQFVPVLTSFFAAAHASPAAGRARRSASGAGIHSRSSTGSPGCSGPDRSPSERSPGLRLLRARLLVRCPGFGGHLLGSSGSRPGPLRRYCRGSPLVSPSRSPMARCRRLRSLLAANQWIARLLLLSSRS
jgi:hypothetical protein